MPDSTIPDAVAADLRDLFLSAQPGGLSLPPDSVRPKHATTEPPSTRLVILCGEPKHVPRMEATGVVDVSLEYITSMDHVSPAEHQAAAGHIDAWWREIRGAKRRDVVATRIYLHDLVNAQASTGIRTDDREQVTTIRGKLTVTLVAI
ncbi:MAG: hypothetical protein V4819_19190 [Verrucomicrobiota bacterium]